MNDFYTIVSQINSRGIMEIKPDFYCITPSGLPVQDIMVKGGRFDCYYNEEAKMWDRSEFNIWAQIDRDLFRTAEEYKKNTGNQNVIIKTMANSSSGSVNQWRKYIQNQMPDVWHETDCKIVFASDIPEKSDYCTHKLDYDLSNAEPKSYNKLVSKLFTDDDLAKIEWALGAVLTNNSFDVQKFFVLHGEGGTGKGTFFKIVMQVCKGYFAPFSSAALVNNSNQFPFEPFKDNPLVAIDGDGKLDNISTNTNLNSLVSHEQVVMNIKNTKRYPFTPRSLVFIGTNSPVKITDARSGLIRRLIDVNFTNERFSYEEFTKLMNGISFESGAIANKCINRFNEMGINYYDHYIPAAMIRRTNLIHNFLNEYFEYFKEKSDAREPILLKDVFTMYKAFCADNNCESWTRQRLGNEIEPYFNDYYETWYDKNSRCRYRSVYFGFKESKFVDEHEINNILKAEAKIQHKRKFDESWIKLSPIASLLDIALGDESAQYANSDGIPTEKWETNQLKLSDIDTSKLHFVRVPTTHIVIDFDLKTNGQKSLEKNIAAASKFPPTYAEVSKSGEGLHLHYIYDGDPTELCSLYDEHIEIKVFTGKSSLRRKLSLCNDLQIAHISSALPKKERKPVFDEFIFNNEDHLKTLVIKAMLKRYDSMPSTTQNVMWIVELLNRAYNQEGFSYDIRDMKDDVLYFARHSTNQSEKCQKLIINEAHFCSKDVEQVIADETAALEMAKNDRSKLPYGFYDIEVYPNLFHISYMDDSSDTVWHLTNPSAGEMAEWVNGWCKVHRFGGYNNLGYDDPMCYARLMGDTNIESFSRSQNIISGVRGAKPYNATHFSDFDIFDYYGDRQKSLKQWEIELKTDHKEMDIPWDQPVKDEDIPRIISYCDTDVRATKAVFHATQPQWVAREIISKWSGLSTIDGTNKHSAQIIFEGNKNARDQFIYTDLTKIFPNYRFDSTKKQSFWLNLDGEWEKIGEGGHAEGHPGIYWNVKVKDVTSMHPHSIKRLNVFGDYYTARFYDMVRLRVLIKQKKFDEAGEMFGGIFKEYLTDSKMAKDLSNALKIVINSVYGMTAANFDNAFTIPGNIDNIVAKYGELFMLTLRDKLLSMGATVVHIKTDSIKVANMTPEIEQVIDDLGAEYGFSFEVEDDFDRICLVNDAVYIGKLKEYLWDDDDRRTNGWHAKAVEFSVPYVFKTLFSHEEVIFDDFCETKKTKDPMYIVSDEGEKFIGKCGKFTPMIKCNGAGNLVKRVIDKKAAKNLNPEDPPVYKFDAVTGTKGYLWMESSDVSDLNLYDFIDKSYYIKKVDDARDHILKVAETYSENDPAAFFD